MNDPITVDEILKALSQLKNGKAASPVTGIPNELLKYGGTPAAQLLLPINLQYGLGVWANTRPVERGGNTIPP